MPPSTRLSSTATSRSTPNNQISDPKALTQILSRLEPKILSTDPHSALRYSAFERTKTQTNLEYARTLLLRSEHGAAGIKVQARKHAVQETLARQRATIKRLSDRLFELGQLDDGRWGSDEEEDDGNEIDGGFNAEEDVDKVLRAVLEDSDEDGAGQGQGQGEAKTKNVPAISSPKSPSRREKPHPQTMATSHQRNGSSLAERRAELLGAKNVEQQSGLRARGGAAATAAAAANTGDANTTGHSFPGKPAPNSKTTTALESAESEHSNLTSSLVSLATQLKLSAQAFSDDLAADEQAVGATEASLGKNKDGLDVATQRMGLLTRMSEGRWWWGRMVLYAMIGGLWVVLILFVFVGPKIRF